MGSISNGDIEKIAAEVTKHILNNENPNFVAMDTCNSRFKSLQHAIYGIYGFLGLLLAGIILQLISN